VPPEGGRATIADRRIREDGKGPDVGAGGNLDLRCAGLVLRIAADGGKSWSFRFRAGGKQTRATIGTYPDIGLTAARTTAAAMRKDVAEGKNPVDQKRAARAVDGAETFGGLADRYLVEHSRRHKRSSAADERNLRKHVLPKWGPRRFDTIKRGDVIALVEGLVTDGKPVLANRVQSLVSGIFTFGMDAALCEANPCHRLKKRGPEKVGRRVLSDAEIRLFWNGIVEPKSKRQRGLGLRLALLTGARIGEVAGICRAELDAIADPTRSAWIIPGTRTKNGRDHLVPLSPLARETVIELMTIIDAREEYLLPTRARHRRGPIQGKALTLLMENFGLRLIADDDAVRTWKAEAPSPHDLRRTVGTRLAELRVPKEIRDRVLNHSASDVGSKHYNLHDYIDEKREAFTRWSLALTAILHGTSATVVPLSARIGRTGQ
jgi:integrase